DPHILSNHHGLRGCQVILQALTCTLLSAMKKYGNRIYLSISTGVFLGILCVLIFLGQPDLLDTIRQDESPWKSFVAALEENPGQRLGSLLAQVIVIIAVVRLFSWICRKIGQPIVSGEIAAGIILGPTWLGLFYH